jgi:geranylgeranylglycerol-phosphate geranylgeranyltransferase
MMQYIHFRQKVATNGDKIIKTADGENNIAPINNAASEIRSQRICNKLHANYIDNYIDNDDVITQYLRTFVYYTKARSNVYIFAFATLISLILGFHGNAVDYGIAVGVICASYFMALAAYIYNDITDFEVDKINKTNRPSVTGKATKRQLIIIVSILNGVALILTSFAGLNAIWISVLFITLGIAYSHRSLNLKDKFPLKTIITAAGAGLLSLLGGTAALTITNSNDDGNNSFSFLSMLPIVYAALFFFAFFFILGPLGDIGDLKGDRIVGRRTFPIVLGIRSTITMMLSVPLIMMLMATSAAYYVYSNDINISNDSKSGTISINILGIILIVGTCITVLAFILRINKKVNDTLTIKAMRPKMRYLHILLQVSLLVTFL